MTNGLHLSETERFSRHGTFSCKTEKFWINRDQVVSWAWARGWVCQRKLPLPLGWNACAVFISGEVHEHLVTQAGDGRQWKLRGARTLAERHCELCRSSPASPQQVPAVRGHGIGHLSGELGKDLGCHKEEKPTGHISPTMPGGNKSSSTTNKKKKHK